ncbi:putative chromatin regulator PHD family [Helianthus annuus]|uniref:Chromatin regulator PHD family n=1 Tax=Helianthus annuus TaxID=4232 RepID=A0A9K3DV10_HELAN|nr:uncharacterized protein LOC110915533 [Helianthus annuus]KAF5760982.1 putative chromatin regulator PHD family [Helianthus annuus]KAJ0438915.1 putative chromatin regulator PHD family [Helianthus annuus]KAJ0443854.1 putative chromatin regulator PHD family [Helianthus annuus]KAJ0461268.1 putative chromatin regulator PHD family [Helianthus annuus]KAJ0641703.1 putative chromatin regulator PHD family [Helianthus annuus]
MDQGYKHFSHLHNLVMHQIPEGTEVSCSGCHSSANGTVYVCWQCNFFLHDQCYRATRSLKHPSHPLHSLTLVPYPTYPSNSFYCDSCRIKGTGFSYSCADCEFDLHVQCAYSISGATSWNGVHNSNMANNVPFVSVPDSHSIPFTHAHNIHSNLNDHAYVNSIPPSYPSSIPTTQNPPISHVKYHSNPHDHTYVNSIPPGRQNSIPTAPNPSISTPTSSIIHFSHPHNLSIVNLNKENKVVCSGCEDNLIGKGFSCSEPNCNFHLHEPCFHLKNEIQHKSHPGHPLKLLPFSPYNNKNREFACSACFGNGRGFTYHCSVCEFDLHVQCVSLPETVKRADHEHALKLFYSCPVKGEEFTVSCDVCQGAIQKDRWAYYCESCDFETHLGCVKGEKRQRDSVMDTQVQLQRLQLEMQMNQQLAQMIAGMGASIASLAP